MRQGHAETEHPSRRPGVQRITEAEMRERRAARERDRQSWTVIDPNAPQRPAEPDRQALHYAKTAPPPEAHRWKISLWNLKVLGPGALLWGVLCLLVPDFPASAAVHVGVLGSIGVLTTIIGLMMDLERRWRQHAVKQREQVRQWTEQYQIHREDLPDNSVREQADRLVTAVAAFEGTRTYQDGLIGEDWEHALHARCWSLLSRLRASLNVRTDLDEAASLTQRTAKLDHVVTERATEVDAFDAELTAEVEQLDQLTAQARDLDAALKADETNRAERERAESLTDRLDGTASTATEREQEHHRIRDLLLAATSGSDLAVLGAGLHSLTRHITHQGTGDPT